MVKNKYIHKIILVLTIIFMILLIFLLLYYNNLNKPKINDFASCAAAGYPIMESYPRQCRANGQTFVEIVDGNNLCTEESRNAEACITIYQPVCGFFNETIQCIKYPCAGTYSNSCLACMDRKVAYWVEGECPI